MSSRRSPEGTTLMFDKTGTLTSGVPEIADVESFGPLPPDELLRLAASLDQVSPHVLASAIVRTARERDVELAFPDDVGEVYGAGIAGTVEGRKVCAREGVVRLAGREPRRAARGRSVGAPSWRARPACSSPSTAWWRGRS